ncbi:MAG: hypothetical protein HYW69_01595 [Candidatus Nealsonbacteria bacterium]|nr:hypothetical protein [Candidatus Nealsonbacteria bacterium]
MRIVLKYSGNIYNFIRNCGYHPHETGEERAGESSFARRLSASDYPRFHIYLKNVSHETFEINLHLDQKKPSYEGATAHSGEYEGELVEKEAERIKQIAGP